jgi:hypothetical protein
VVVEEGLAPPLPEETALFQELGGEVDKMKRGLRAVRGVAGEAEARRVEELRVA